MISSHTLPEVAALTDRAVFLNQGQIACQGRWDELPGGPTNPDQTYFEVIKDAQAG
jgi:ABC-type Na+ transport system ATPase subunit NatA